MQAWEIFLKTQEEELGQETVQKWLRSLKIQKFDAGNLYLEANDSFQALWFEEHIRGKAQLKLVTGNNKKIKVHLSVSNTPTNNEKKTPKSTRKTSAKVAPFALTFDELDPHCTLDQYIVSDENIIPHKLIQEITTIPSKDKEAKLGTFNPLFLYGAAGSGKTHLLMSIAHSLRAKGLRIHYVRAETFTDHVVSAIRAGEMSVFRQAYRNIDILIVDGVHVFSRKGATQEEFFHTFNTLHLAGKQIVLSANCSPQELQLIEPRLVSRFEWGIVLPVKPLATKEDLKRMLGAKADALQFPLTDKLAEFLGDTFLSSPKALIKALKALVLRLHLDSVHQVTNLSLVSAKTLLADLIQEEEKSALTAPKVIQAVAEHFGIRREDIIGKVQTKECTLPRQLAMYLIRHHLKTPYIKIGDLFERDHSTVMSSIKRIQKSYDLNEENIVNALQSIQKKF